jgi:hypothetical protein
VLDRPGVDELLDRSGDVLDRDVRVDAVLVEEIERRRGAVGRASATRLMCSGRLDKPVWRPSPSRSKPNLVAITT